MNQAGFPQLPTLSDTPDGSRLTTELRRFVDMVLREGLFLTRQKPGRAIIPLATGDTQALSWESLNRVQLSANATVQLPRISPRYVGIPLYLSKLTGTGTLTLIPVGLGTDRKTTSLVNNAASVAVASAKLYVLIHDGLHWSMTT